MFQSLTRDSNHSNSVSASLGAHPAGFNPSRGIAIIQTHKTYSQHSDSLWFQSLTRDSNHSNTNSDSYERTNGSFNPSRGIAIIQTWRAIYYKIWLSCFNPSRGIAIIQTVVVSIARRGRGKFQSLTRDSNHSNDLDLSDDEKDKIVFQFLTRDSNHSNPPTVRVDSADYSVSIPHAG